MSNAKSSQGTVWCVVIGLLLGLLGAILLAVVPSPEVTPDYKDPCAAMGWFCVVVAVPLFFGAIIVELFTIGAVIRRLESSRMENARQPSPGIRLAPASPPSRS